MSGKTEALVAITVFLVLQKKQNLNTTVSPCAALNSLSGNQQNVIFEFYL